MLEIVVHARNDFLSRWARIIHTVATAFVDYFVGTHAGVAAGEADAGAAVLTRVRLTIVDHFFARNAGEASLAIARESVRTALDTLAAILARKRHAYAAFDAWLLGRARLLLLVPEQIVGTFSHLELHLRRALQVDIVIERGHFDEL